MISNQKKQHHLSQSMRNECINVCKSESSNKEVFNRSLLFIDYAVPMYDKYAGSRTNFMYLEILVKNGMTVKFLPADFKRVEPYSSEINNLGIETLDGKWFIENWENWFKTHGKEIDYVFFNKPEPTMKFLQAVKKHTNAAVIYQCHDLHYLRLRRKSEIEGDEKIMAEADRFERQENFIFECSDVILTFSSVEKSIIKEGLPEKKVVTVPLFLYESVMARKFEFKQTHDLLFVGGCAHTPNLDAINWFCKEVFPLVKQHLPDVIFNIIGSTPPKIIRDLKSKYVRILDQVSDEELKTLYEKVRLAVIPLRFGAGVKGKTIEALYHGVPIVSTSIGLEGIKGIEQFVSPQDEAADFATELVSLYNSESKWKDFVQKSSAFFTEHLALNKTTNLVGSILETAREEHLKRVAAAEPPRLISFYLPQYHPIPENDEWWGMGFTEWRNVAKAKPLFPGHYQPHLPADLGFYDLRSEETRIAQAEMAREYGIYGFCFYHYWFNEKRLLERPVEEILSSGKPDFPFCLCWANENWTRRWDGEDQHVLMKQKYSEEDDRKHIKYLIQFFRDERYIRVDDKPIFLVYRTENMPDPAKTAKIWREAAWHAGIGELYLVRVESIGKLDPADINFDAALEFAPDWWNKGRQLKTYPRQGNETEEELAALDKFHSNNYIHSYDKLVEKMLAKPTPDYKWLRCVTPSWDNTARRNEGAHVFLDSNPEKYKHWLERVINSTRKRLVGDEKMVFINAWNEWAEGNHLEPDQKYGRDYLDATRCALQLAYPALDKELKEIESLTYEFDINAKSPVTLNSTFQQKLDNLNLKLAERERKIVSLEHLLFDKVQLLEEIYGSKSWRVTAPLRFISRKLHSLINNRILKSIRFLGK
jgi:glycosyltransferase involved in cell wall biosynthesis